MGGEGVTVTHVCAIDKGVTFTGVSSWQLGGKGEWRDYPECTLGLILLQLALTWCFKPSWPTAHT